MLGDHRLLEFLVVTRRSETPWPRDDRLTALIAVVLLALLAPTSLHSYLLFHTLAELSFIIVCVTVIIMAWSLRQFLDDDFVVFLGLALAFVAILHTVHLVDYPGLNMISDSLDPPTQLWLGARLLLAATFIAAPFVVGRRLNLRLVVACYAVCDVLLLATIYLVAHLPCHAHAGRPDALQEGDGVRHLPAVRARHRPAVAPARPASSAARFRLLRAALVASIVAELWFSVYHSVATWPNLVGHLFLVLSALLFFRAVVDDGLARPHARAMTSLREAEQLHRRLELGLMPTIPVKPEGLDVLSLYRPGEHYLALSGDFIDVLDRGEARRRRDLRRRQRPRPQPRRARRHAPRQLAGAVRERRRSADHRRESQGGPAARAQVAGFVRHPLPGLDRPGAR